MSKQHSLHFLSQSLESNPGIDPKGEPTKPNLNIVKVNLDGTLYTWKVAVHYFRKQPDTDERDRCFIITGSMVAWIDSPVGSSRAALWNFPDNRVPIRVTGNIQQLNMAFVDLCELHVGQAGNKASE